MCLPPAHRAAPGLHREIRSAPGRAEWLQAQQLPGALLSGQQECVLPEALRTVRSAAAAALLVRRGNVLGARRAVAARGVVVPQSRRALIG